MRVRLLGILALTPLLVSALAGCLDDEGPKVKSFDALPVPTWSTGYSWTYDVTSSYHGMSTERGNPLTESETEKDSFTLSVVNETEDFEGEPVYYVRASDSIDHPFMQGTLQAVTKAGLEIAGFGYHQPNMMEVKPHPSRSFSSYYPPQPKDPCEGVTMMEMVEPGRRSPGFRFPLDDGQTWTGSWGETGDMEFTYTSKVRGITPVQVPAGVFPSVYIETEFAPVVPNEFQGEAFPMQFRIRTEAWYSPDVRYLTKMVVSAEASGSDPEGRFGSVSFEFLSTMQLREFSLSPGPAEPISVVVQQRDRAYDMPAMAPVGFSIVADQALPVELGSGPVAVQFGLAPFSEGGPYDGRMRTVEGGVPSTVDIDHTTHEVVWMVSRYGDWEWPWQESVGDTLTQTFEEGGRYAVQAHIRPIKCGEPYRSFTSADLTTTVTRVFDAAIGPGMTSTTDVGEFQVEPEITRLVIEWSQEPAAGVAVDEGHLILIGPSGDRHDVYSSPYVESYIYPAGQWRLQWASDRPTVGDDVSVVVKTVYDPWFSG